MKDVCFYLPVIELNPTRCAICELTVYLIQGSSIDKDLSGTVIVERIGFYESDEPASVQVHSCDPVRANMVRLTRLAGTMPGPGKDGH